VSGPSATRSLSIGILNWRDLASREAGGAEVFVHEVAHCWQEWGHRVLLCSAWERGLRRHDAEGALEILRVGRLRDGSHHALAPRALRRYRPLDVVLESINTVPYLLPLRRNFPPFLPLIHQVAEEVWDAHVPPVLASLAKGVERGLFAPYRRRHAIAVSESTRQDLLGRGLVDVDVVTPAGPGPQLVSPKEPYPTILFVGRLRANKRPEDAVEAFRLMRKEMPNARLWIVGEGELRSRLEATLPSGAHMLGRLAREELTHRMARAHVLVMTSVREGWGLVATEAQAFGTPVVAYDVPGLRDSIQHAVTGYLVSPRPSALAAQVVDIISRRDAYESMRVQAFRRGAARKWSETSRELLTYLHATRAESWTRQGHSHHGPTARS
jgi:glycosyltransferase involved in cell wall biosynthesis